MAKPSNYWDKRAIKRLTDAEKQSEAYIKRIQKIYDRAHKNIQRDIDTIYRNYAKNTGLDVQSLKTLLTKSETQKLWQELQAKGLDKYVKGNYKARISRLEKLQAQIYAKAKEIYPEEQLEQTMCYRGVINDSYYKAIYDTQMGTGLDFAFSNLDDNMVTALLNENWSGKNYSQRIWGNTDILAESLSELVGGAMLSGQSIAKTSRQVRERFGVSKYYAERLVRTETNHFNNEADAMAYEEMGVDKYVFLATLDTRTSDICQSLDNKVFDLKDRQVGVNYPPMHPNCRSKTRAYMGEEIEKTLKRRARNPITNENEVIDNMPYSEWAKKHGIDTMDKKTIKAYNSLDSYDRKQYENYKNIFSEINTVDKFKEIKYNDSELWERYKKEYRVLNQYKMDNGTLSNSKILELDKKAISFKQNALRSSEKRSGNIGIIELDGNTYYAHSRLNLTTDKGYKNLDNTAQNSLILKPNDEIFKAKEVDGYIRNTDSEYKLFNYIATQKQPSDTFTVNMLSERCMCESCIGVMEQFKKMYPNATVNVVSNKTMKHPWKYRGRKK
jgi:SPP1 gp7 family putative phage head morphogenesis protein